MGKEKHEGEEIDKGQVWRYHLDISVVHFWKTSVNMAGSCTRSQDLPNMKPPIELRSLGFPGEKRIASFANFCCLKTNETYSHDNITVSPAIEFTVLIKKFFNLLYKCNWESLFFVQCDRISLGKVAPHSECPGLKPSGRSSWVFPRDNL